MKNKKNTKAKATLKKIKQKALLMTSTIKTKTMLIKLTSPHFMSTIISFIFAPRIKQKQWLLAFIQPISFYIMSTQRDVNVINAKLSTCAQRLAIIIYKNFHRGIQIKQIIIINIISITMASFKEKNNLTLYNLQYFIVYIFIKFILICLFFSVFD